MKKYKVDVTNLAREIFGDIVEHAYLYSRQDITERFFAKDSIEPNDGDPVFVKFSNGKSFQIWSSEWGGVTKISEDDFIKDERPRE